MESQKTYILFYKPYGVLSQFTHENGYAALCDYGPFPKNVYPAGRLDADSEGLLFLTDDTNVNHRLIDPSFGHERTYLVQIEGIPSAESLSRLHMGVRIESRETKPAIVRFLETEPDVPKRSVPIRERKNIPTSWIELTIREGRNRQVRKMTAAIGHPTLRLIRSSIAFFTLEGLTPGTHRLLELSEVDRLYTMLQLTPSR